MRRKKNARKGRRKGASSPAAGPPAAPPSVQLRPAGQAGAGAQPVRQGAAGHSLWVGVPPLPKGNAQKIARNAATGSMFVVNDKRVIERQRVLSAALRSCAPSTPLTGPVRLHVTFVLQVATSWPKWKQAAALSGCVLPYTQATGSSGGIPDRGNLLKLVEDCLEKSGWLLNDSQICGGLVAKCYGAKPGYLIELQELDEVATLAAWKARLQREELGALSGVHPE